MGKTGIEDSVTVGLLDSDEKFRALVEHAVVGIYIIQNGRFSYVNERLAEIFGYEQHELIGKSNLDLTHPDDRDLATKNIRKRIEGHEESIEYSFRGVTKGGEIKYIRVFGSVFGSTGERAIIGTLIDETETVIAKQQLEKLANYDTLTGLYNRHVFVDEFRRAVALGNRRGHKVALIVFDIDNFKRINDSLGHKAGDRLLEIIGERIARILRKTDLFARIGGDEFAIIVEDYLNLEEIGVLIGRIQNAVHNAVEIEGLSLHISISLGVSLFPEHGRDIETLQKAADIALYEAKKNGKNRFAFFAHNSDVMFDNIQMENELFEAIDKKELMIHLQPQIDLKSGDICGAEALIRWNHSQKGIIPPDRFLPLARELGILYKIDTFVIESVLEMLERWKEACRFCPVVSVNISSALFHHQRFLPTMKEMRRRYGVICESVELELTEDILIENERHAYLLIKALKSLGFKLSIDDFGTGFSSLSHLKMLEVDKLKIDRSFIEDIAGNPNDMAIVKSIIVMGHTLGLAIVAEGVESEGQRTILESIGCDIIQGYLYSKPLPVEAFEKMWLPGLSRLGWQ
ncbi:putative bifunctional diguanylate cyclase/phosphodiesterase [Hydrogenimonas urashimensis]|uniref:putative bifunctional diguanylate cyclase/phosphodiesterase n=1 Tax=Hydrogenimonas urashimensis TaxID=2740515 RepID=UPI001915E7D6|nr:EAL domain-containing protein [Hydrogenimonas urashimensis]